MHTTTLQELQIQSQKLSQLLAFAEVCTLLRKSRSGVYKLMAADPSFPRPVKDGISRSSRAFFVANEVAAWQQAKLDARTAS